MSDISIKMGSTPFTLLQWVLPGALAAFWVCPVACLLFVITLFPFPYSRVKSLQRMKKGKYIANFFTTNRQYGI